MRILIISVRVKSKSSPLTASRKKPVRPSRSRPQRRRQPKSQTDRLDALDGLRLRCESLTALAGLLEACGDHRGGQPLERDIIGHTGSLIRREVEQAGVLLDKLEEVQ